MKKPKIELPRAFLHWMFISYGIESESYDIAYANAEYGIGKNEHWMNACDVVCKEMETYFFSRSTSEQLEYLHAKRLNSLSLMETEKRAIAVIDALTAKLKE